MNRKQFRDKIFDKWRIKVLCFAAAMLVYFLHQIAILETKVFSIPVDVQAYGSMIPSEINEHLVKVTVRGKSEELSAILESDLSAYLDITSITKEGEANVPVIIKPSKRLSVLDPLEINVKPDKIKIDVQLREELFVPVVPVVTGECGYGYEVKSINSEPAVIMISGPRKMVESVKEIQTERVDVSDCRNSIEQSVLPRNSNRLISIDSTEEIDVYVEIKEIETTGQYDNLGITCTRLSDQFEIQDALPKASVWIDGTMLNLEKLKSSSISVTVDCSSVTAPGEYELPVYVKVPYLVKLSRQEPEKISVVVKEIPPVQEELSAAETVMTEESVIQ